MTRLYLSSAATALVLLLGLEALVHAAPPRYPPRRRYSPVISFNLDPQENLNTSLRIAARENQLKDLLDALKNGAKINSTSARGVTALMNGSRNCYPEIVQALIDAGADINAQDYRGRTALMLAARGSCLSVFKALLSRPEINLSLKDKSKRSVKDFAIAGTALEVDGPSHKIIQLLRAKYQKKAAPKHPHNP